METDEQMQDGLICGHSECKTTDSGFFSFHWQEIFDSCVQCTKLQRFISDADQYWMLFIGPVCVWGSDRNESMTVSEKCPFWFDHGGADLKTGMLREWQDIEQQQINFNIS